MFNIVTDPVMRAPTIGSMLMCLSAALIGVVTFIRRRSLIGESLSHASYPGVVLSVLIGATFFPYAEEGLAIGVLIGAFLSSVLGLLVIEWMQKRLRIASDAALCFVLASFFGVGVLIASRLQFTHALWYKQIHVFLYGQAATMTDIHVAIYFTLALITCLIVFFCYRPIQALCFDRSFVEAIGVRVNFFEALTVLLLILSIVVGMRCVGVVLVSGMAIAPAVAARQWTHRLSLLFVLAGFFGLVSGFLGNYFSVKVPLWSGVRLALPTGPMILLSSALICFFSLFFAPQVGLLSRLIRVLRFRQKRLQENILKLFWRAGEGTWLSLEEIRLTAPFMRICLFQLISQGWMVYAKRKYRLTPDGWKRAQRIVRLHRLWEVYLVDYLGQGAQKVHQNAEEMEHILTPELERELTELLADPKHDPHHQPIPEIR